MNRRLEATPAFDRAVKRWLKLRPEGATALQTTLHRLAADAFDPSLHTHKLRGKLADRLACSAGYDVRVLFRIVGGAAGETIQLLALGTHDEVY